MSRLRGWGRVRSLIAKPVNEHQLNEHQPERQGWACNVNFLLDKVDTEFFFLYFYDDVIVPQYTG